MFNLSGTKQLKLTDGSYINYELIKKYRRTVSLKITPKGLIVNAPILMTNYKIDQLLQKKSYLNVEDCISAIMIATKRSKKKSAPQESWYYCKENIKNDKYAPRRLQHQTVSGHGPPPTETAKLVF